MVELVLEILRSGAGIAAAAVLALVVGYLAVCHLVARWPWRS